MTLNQLLPPRRPAYLLAFTVCAALIGYALYVQYVQLLEPCPLCMLQRVGVIGSGVVMLLAGLHKPGRRGAIVYALLNLLVAGFGAAIAVRHLWIQSLPPDQVPLCGPGLSYMLDTMPLGDALLKVLHGSGECADKSWQFLGLTMPGWTLIFFIGLIAWGFVLIVKEPKSSR